MSQFQKTVEIPSPRHSSKSPAVSGTSALVTIFQMSLDLASILSSRDEEIFIRKPVKVDKNALDSFETDLHKSVKTLKNISDEELERLIGERNSGDIDPE